jgi:thiol-disulfide isomerase/thioredoxin
MAVKNKKLHRKTKRHMKHSVKSSSKSINVRSLNDVKNAVDVIKKSKITIVFVYADWCPHCHTYKPLWSKLQKRRGSNVGMVSVEQKNAQPILENIQDENGQQMQADSFPKIIAVSNGTGAEIPNSRDEVAMTNLVANGDKIMANNTAIPSANNKPSSVVTPDLMNEVQMMEDDTMATENEENELKEMNAVNASNSKTPKNEIFEPPQLGESNIKTPTNKSSTIIGGSRGGSLYESLVAFSGPTAPALGLLAAQQMFARNKYSKRKSKKTFRKKHRK